MPVNGYDRIEFTYDPDNPDYSEVSGLNPFPVQLQDFQGNGLWVGQGGGLLGGFQPFPITGQTTNYIKEGYGILHAITFNKPIATSVVTFYDGLTTATGTLLGTITIPASPMLNYFLYDVEFQRGLIVVQATASSDITVSYR